MSGIGIYVTRGRITEVAKALTYRANPEKSDEIYSRGSNVESKPLILKGGNMKIAYPDLEIYYEDLWVRFYPQTEKGKTLIREYRGTDHEWYRFMADAVGYDEGIIFPYNRVNKFTTYVNVRLRKEKE